MVLWVLGTRCWVFKVLPRASPIWIPMGPSGKVTDSGIIPIKILLLGKEPARKNEFFHSGGGRELRPTFRPFCS